jgi:hypothetical protein
VACCCCCFFFLPYLAGFPSFMLSFIKQVGCVRGDQAASYEPAH